MRGIALLAMTAILLLLVWVPAAAEAGHPLPAPYARHALPPPHPNVLVALYELALKAVPEPEGVQRPMIEQRPVQTTATTAIVPIARQVLKLPQSAPPRPAAADALSSSVGKVRSYTRVGGCSGGCCGRRCGR